MTDDPATRAQAPGIEPDDVDPAAEAEWRRTLTEGHRSLRFLTSIFKRLPHDPRCKLCHNPFGGVGGRVVGMFGFRPSRKNPNMCQQCCEKLPRGGAEVDIAVLFADVRGSVELGGTMSSERYAALLNRFYLTASRVLIRHDAIVDKLIGDEVMALFIPGFTGPEYRARSVSAAIDLVDALGWGENGAPWLGVGVGVHAGPAYVGNVGPSDIADFTALGDTVNIAARLQSAAAPGEVLITESVFREAQAVVPARAIERTIELRGKDQPITVRAISPAHAATTAQR